ncbi:MAG TPA: RNA polymerase sigma factor [Gammaproteobacteria bacterium]
MPAAGRARMDQAAFRRFYRETAPALRAYIARSVGSLHAADDVLQDAFVRFLTKAPPLLSEAEMRGYLYRTAETLVVDRWRRHRREGERDRAAAELLEEAVDPALDGDVERAFRGSRRGNARCCGWRTSRSSTIARSPLQPRPCRIPTCSGFAPRSRRVRMPR